LESSKECVITHLPNHYARKIDRASAVALYCAVKRVESDGCCCEGPASACLELQLVQILIVVADSAVRSASLKRRRLPLQQILKVG